MNIRADLDQLTRCPDLTEGDIWDVLSALRGPDNRREDWKKHFTLPIRRYFFPLSLAPVDPTDWSALGKEAENLAAKAPLPDTHYLYHIAWAINVILKIEDQKKRRFFYEQRIAKRV